MAQTTKDLNSLSSQRPNEKQILTTKKKQHMFNFYFLTMLLWISGKLQVQKHQRNEIPTYNLLMLESNSYYHETNYYICYWTVKVVVIY